MTELKDLLKNERDLKMALDTIELIKTKHKILFIGVVGSKAHGTDTEKSDFDIRIIYKTKSENFFSIYDKVNSIFLFLNREDLLAYRINGSPIDFERTENTIQYQSIDTAKIPDFTVVNTIKYSRNKSEEDLKLDIESYEIGHFFKLIEKSDVNAFELLNLTEDCIIQTSEEFDLLRSNKEKFLSKETYNSFINYATNQFKTTKKETRKFRLNPKDIFDCDIDNVIIKKLVKVQEKDIIQASRSMELTNLKGNKVPIEKDIMIILNTDEKEMYLCESAGNNFAFFTRLNRKSPLDFCYVDRDRHNFSYGLKRFKKNFVTIIKLKTSLSERIKKIKDEFNFIFYDPHKISLKTFLDECDINQKFCGLSQNDVTLTYYLFYDKKSEKCFDEDKYTEKQRINNKKKYKGEFEFFKGIIKENETKKFSELNLSSNELRKSPIRKGKKILTKFVYRQDLYSQYCNNYKEYLEWLEYRDPVRFETNLSHNQNMDTKNAAHMVRIIELYHDMLRDGYITNKRPNREYLLSIKHGKIPLSDVIEHSDKVMNAVNEMFKTTTLSEKQNRILLNELLTSIRNKN